MKIDAHNLSSDYANVTLAYDIHKHKIRYIACIKNIDGGYRVKKVSLTEAKRVGGCYKVLDLQGKVVWRKK